MSAVCRLGDVCTGHDGFAPRPCVQGSPNVFVNGLPAHRLGDAWSGHSDGNSTHAAILAGGSATVFVNGKPLGRIGDPVSCGSRVATGSGNVFAG